VRARPATARAAGFSLLELMLALVVVAVLWLLAMPAYRGQLMAANRALARAALLESAARQEQFRAEHRRYAAGLHDLGFPGDTYVIDREGQPALAGTRGAIYNLRLSTGDGTFTLFAEPLGAQAGDRRCGTLTLSSLGIRGATGGADAAECW